MRDHILELDRAVPARASEFLIDGWQPEEALLRIGHAMGRPVAVAAPGPVAANGRRSAAGFEGPREIDRDAEVLIADDDMTVRMIVRSAIQGAGIKCRMACDGTEALQMARDCRPPAAVLDVNMPGMDGYEVLAAIRNEALPVRVILLTARQQEADITRGFTLGADDYVVKPFNPAELLARLKRFLWQ
jgi:CheY-like chemotaxis protein